MSYQEFLSFERRGAVGIVRLARPEKLNTISAPFYEAMIELQQAEIVGDHNLRAIALLADGRHFSAGIDLNYAKAVIGKPGRSLYGVYHWQQAYRFWSECNLPVVVGIQGACMAPPLSSSRRAISALPPTTRSFPCGRSTSASAPISAARPA